MRKKAGTRGREGGREGDTDSERKIKVNRKVRARKRESAHAHTREKKSLTVSDRAREKSFERNHLREII